MKITLSEFDILHKIKQSLLDKTPMLITRFGEGEMRLFGDIQQSNWILKNSLGYTPNEEIKSEIRNNLETALIHSDVTGLPSFNGNLDENTVLRTELHDIYKMIYPTFRKIFHKNNIQEDNFVFCDINIHSNFFNNNLFIDLLQNLDELTIITCREIDNDLKSFFNIKKINRYIIPPEYRYEEDIDDVQWNFYPNIHHDIKNSILSKDNSGKLLLYGAGVAGKDLGYYFKKSGGVAFDIGSVFDRWAGRLTRGPGKGKGIWIESPLKIK